MIELSKRMKAVADMVTPGVSVADVGCDHGFVSIYLIQQRIATRVIAMDVNEGPLAIAKRHIAEWGLSEYIDTRLSDGLREIQPKSINGDVKPEVEAMICAGMGGRLMVRILKDELEKVRGMKELILQPQSEIKYMREFLMKSGFRIIDENMVLDEGKYYVILKAVPSPNRKITKEEELYLQYGRILLSKKNPVLKEYLLKLQEQYTKILSRITSDNEKAIQDRKNMEQKLSGVNRALELMDKS